MTTAFRRTRFAIVATLGLLAAGAAARAEEIALPGNLSVTLPDGWELDGPQEGRVSANGMRRIQLVCTSEACEKTQETCTILMREKDMDGADDAAKLRGLYASPFQRYFRLRAVLKSTSKDAEVLKPLAITTYGKRQWYRIETDARHNFKSGLFAETVIDGLYVGAICKTCEQGEVRHRGGEAIIASIRPQVSRFATLR